MNFKSALDVKVLLKYNSFMHYLYFSPSQFL